jgi:hypothetical protein
MFVFYLLEEEKKQQEVLATLTIKEAGGKWVNTRRLRTGPPIECPSILPAAPLTMYTGDVGLM